MQIRYNKYFKHWRDFDLLTCILAMIGLCLAIVDYENNPPYGKSIEDIRNQTIFVRVIISMTTFLAIVALLGRMWVYTFWVDYRSSKEFYKKMM